MAFGVEGRYPFLDHKVVEAALSIPEEGLYRRGWTKLPLRRGFDGVVPAAVRWRRSKFGFETPQDRWVRVDLLPQLRSFVDGDSPVWDVVDRASATALVDRLAHGRCPVEASQAIVRAVIVDRWLRSYGVDVSRATAGVARRP
jgi:asparagine synthase (glutamine-hydrolysing)